MISAHVQHARRLRGRARTAWASSTVGRVGATDRAATLPPIKILVRVSCVYALLQ